MIRRAAAGRSQHCVQYTAAAVLFTSKRLRRFAWPGAGSGGAGLSEVLGACWRFVDGKIIRCYQVPQFSWCITGEFGILRSVGVQAACLGGLVKL